MLRLKVRLPTDRIQTEVQRADEEMNEEFCKLMEFSPTFGTLCLPFKIHVLLFFFHKPSLLHFAVALC